MTSEKFKQAMVTSLRMLAVTPKSRRLLRRKLLEKGYGEALTDQVLDQLEKRGVLDDRVFAQSILQSFTTHRASGRRRIVFELEKRGVAGRLIEEVLERYRPEQERENAFELAKAKWGRWIRLDPMRRKKKVYDFILRRGFDFALAREIVDSLD